jgi:hypothetical protein
MSPDVQLILGCLGLGLAIGYALWVRVRADLLRLDLMAISIRLDVAMASKGITQDRHYLRLRQIIAMFIESAPYLSLAVLSMNLARAGEGVVTAEEIPQFSFSNDMPEDVSIALADTVKRVLIYMTLECLSGWPILLALPWLILTGRLHRNTGLPAQLIRLAVRHSG